MTDSTATAKKAGFTMDDCLDVIREFAQSQGFYGRLLRQLSELKRQSPEDYDRLKDEWESRGFTDTLDFILYLEQ